MGCNFCFLTTGTYWVNAALKNCLYMYDNANESNLNVILLPILKELRNYVLRIIRVWSVCFQYGFI